MLQLTLAIYYCLAVITVGSALMVIFSRNALYSALALIITMCAIASNFLLMRAELVALVQIMVYAGAIMVLFLFVIMLLNIREGEEKQKKIMMIKPIGALIAGVFVLQTAYVAFKLFMVQSVSSEPMILDATARETVLTTETFATDMFTRYMLPFELTSVLLLVAIIGAMAIGLKEQKREA